MNLRAAICTGVLLILTSTTSVASPQDRPEAPWSHTDLALTALYEAELYMDWRQTMTFTQEKKYKQNGYYERNPLIGKYPSAQRVTEAVLLSAVLTPCVAYLLPPEKRTLFLVVITTAEGLVVYGNIQTGVTVKF